MRGRGLRPLGGVAAVVLVVLMLALPALALPGPAFGDAVDRPDENAPPARSPEGTGALQDRFTWTEHIPLEDLAPRARQEAEGSGPTTLPAPDVLGGYDALPEPVQREAWRVWLVLATSSTMMQTATPWAAAAAQSPADNVSTVAGLGAPRGLKSIWSLDTHGAPRGVLPAGDGGETFLVTSRGVMRFGGANATPDWMVKPGGAVGQAETTDFDGDGVLDIVIGTRSWYASEDPSVVVVDGAEGTVIWAGLLGNETVLDWTLTDVDGDGKDDLIGVDQRQNLIAYRLDGTLIYSERPEALPAVGPVGVLVFYLAVYSDSYDGHSFGDVDQDGVQDFFVLSDYRAYARALYFGESVYGGVLSAVSGKDLSSHWSVPMEPRYSPMLHHSGDFDGDGSDDVLLISDLWVSGIGGRVMEHRWSVRSGSDGATLAEDRGFGVVACPSDCVRHDTRQGGRWPLGLIDLDGDGGAEVVTIVDLDDPQVPYAVAGLTSNVPGGPLMEAWRHEIKLDAAHDRVYLETLLLRDPDGDGVMELFALVQSEDRTDEGALEDMAMHVFRMGAAGITGGRMPEHLGHWDLGGDGQAYGWTVRDDRWRPLDGEGKPQSDGLRLVTNSYVLLMHDITRDKVPDIFMPKSVGFMWIDGRDGALLHDVERPIDTYVHGVYREGKEHFLLERDWGEGSFELLALSSLEPVWELVREELDQGWLRLLTDVTGDGKLDVVVEKRAYMYEEFGEDSVPLRSPGMDSEATTTVIDMTTQKVAWEWDTSNGHVDFDDVLPARPGDEMLVTSRGDTATIDLHVFGETKPRWSYPTGHGGFRAAELGYVLISNEQEGEVFEILSGDSGELVSSYPLPADGHATQVYLTPVDADRFPETVMSIAVEEGEDEYTQEMIIYDWAREQELARFPLERPKITTFYWEDYSFSWPSYSYITADVGDWDGDGLVDFAYRETDRPLVRSSAEGKVLALAPGKGTIFEAVDLNGDGQKEIGVRSDAGRMRFFTYAPTATAADTDDEDGIRVIKQVEGSQSSEGVDDFFKSAEKKGLPAPGIMLSLVLLGLVLRAARRRP